MVALKVDQELLLELGDFGGLDLIEVSSDSGIDDTDLFFSWEWGVLFLFQQLGKLGSSVQQLLGGSIQIRSELGEGSDFSVLGELKLHLTSDLLHGLDLGGRSDSGDGKTDVDGGSDTLEEKFGFEENLSISNGNNVGGDIGGDVTGLGLDDWESGEGSSSVLLVELGGSLEETRVEIEHISWVGLSTGWSSQQEGHLSVGDGLLGKIVVDDEGVSSVISEELTDGGSGVWGQELEWGGVGGGSGNDDGVLHGVLFGEDVDDVGNSGLLLSDSDVDAVELLDLITSLEVLSLVDDGIDGDSSLSGLSISDDQLSLSSSDWDQTIDGLKSGLHWLVDGLSWDDTWGSDFDELSLGGLDGSLSVDGVSEWVQNSSDHLVSDGDVNDGSGSSDDITFSDFSIVTQDDDTDVIGFQVKGHTSNSGGELNQFSGLDLGQSENSGNTISD